LGSLYCRIVHTLIYKLYIFIRLFITYVVNVYVRRTYNIHTYKGSSPGNSNIEPDFHFLSHPSKLENSLYFGFRTIHMYIGNCLMSKCQFFLNITIELFLPFSLFIVVI